MVGDGLWIDLTPPGDLGIRPEPKLRVPQEHLDNRFDVLVGARLRPVRVLAGGKHQCVAVGGRG